MIFDIYPWFVNRLISESMVSNEVILSERAANIEAHFSSIVNGVSVLDVGCCDGRWAAWALNAGATSVHGIDIESNFIASANNTFAEHHSSEAEAPLTGYTFEEKGWADISDTDSYDCVLLFGCHYVYASGLEAIDKVASVTDTILFESGDYYTTAFAPEEGQEDIFYGKSDVISRLEANGFTVTDHSAGTRVVLVAQKE
jgi:SAM-dependent methyltransferase